MRDDRKAKELNAADWLRLISYYYPELDWKLVALEDGEIAITGIEGNYWFPWNVSWSVSEALESIGRWLNTQRLA